MDVVDMWVLSTRCLGLRVSFGCLRLLRIQPDIPDEACSIGVGWKTFDKGSNKASIGDRHGLCNSLVWEFNVSRRKPHAFHLGSIAVDKPKYSSA